MVTTLVLAAAFSLTPAQTPTLGLSNDRITFGGEFGPVRPSNKLLPGDTFFLVFDIDNLKLDEYGRVNYMMGMYVTDSAGKSIYEQKPAKQQAILPLGGNKLPARAFVGLSVAQAPGTYNCRVTVTDLATDVTKSLDKQFEVLPRAFGLVGMFCSSDDKGEVPAPMMGLAGQSLWMHFAVVAFERDAKTKQPNIEIQMRAFDANGKATVDLPMSYSYVKDVDEKLEGIPVSLPLPMNRIGTFTIEIRAEDKVSGRTSRMAFPVAVLQPVK